MRALQDEAIQVAVAAAAAEEAVVAAELVVAETAATELVARTTDSNITATSTPDDPPSSTTSLSGGDLSASPSTQSLLEYTSIDDDDDDENDHGDVVTELPQIVEPAKQRSTLESLLQTQKQQLQDQINVDGLVPPALDDVNAAQQTVADTAAEPLTDNDKNVANNLNNNQMADGQQANDDVQQAMFESTEATTSPKPTAADKSPDGHAAAQPTFDLNENDPTDGAVDSGQLDNLPDGCVTHRSELIEFDGDRAWSAKQLDQPSLPDALSGAETDPAAAANCQANDLDAQPPVQIACSNNIGTKQFSKDDVPTSPSAPSPRPSSSPSTCQSAQQPAPSLSPSSTSNSHQTSGDAIAAQLCSAQLKQATISLVEEPTSETVEATAAPLHLTPFHAMSVPTLTTANLKSLATAAATVTGASQSGVGNNGHSVLSTSLDSSIKGSTLQLMNADERGYHGGGPERSYSLESLNSETSVDSNDSKSSLKLAEQKFNKNGTLERQQTAAAAAAVAALAATTSASALPSAPVSTNAAGTAPVASAAAASAAYNNASAPPPSGLQVLVLWNNGLTRDSAKTFGDLLAETTSLEILNVGRNLLSNDFLANVRDSLKTNTSLTSLGLQSAHLTCTGLRTLSECLEFGGNSTLQRIDVRDNHLQVAGLTALNDVLKSNKTVTRVDLDDVPRRAHVSIWGGVRRGLLQYAFPICQ